MELEAAILGMIMVFGLYVIIGIGIAALLDEDDYPLVFGLLWPVLVIMVAIKQLIDFVKEEILR